MEDKTKVLNDELLEQVVGGVSTLMQCSKCPPVLNEMMWAGDFRGKGPFKCPHCGNMTLFGSDSISPM